MNILIVGFNNYAEMDRAMNEMIAETGQFLFNVLCGGMDMSHPQQSLASQWAKKNGAPIVYYYESTMDKLLWKLGKDVDYIVMKVDDNTPQVWKNFLMKMKSEGKHGKIIKA